ncbi:hypothetical protein LXL04_020661 [Taraxacum kok-saghyz]
MEEGDTLRTRSFRNEDYNNRRVFLRSYPLHFNNDEDHQEQETYVIVDATSADGDDYKKQKKTMKMKKKKEAMKKIMVTIIEWGGGRGVVFRNFKHKVSFYVVACFPLVFKQPKAFISVGNSFSTGDSDDLNTSTASAKLKVQKRRDEDH